MSRHKNPIVDEAAKAVGGIRQLADKLAITYQAVRKWRQIPVERVFDVERATGIPRERLRPDIFGSGAPRPRPKRRNAWSAAA